MNRREFLKTTAAAAAEHPAKPQPPQEAKAAAENT